MFPVDGSGFRWLTFDETTPEFRQMVLDQKNVKTILDNNDVSNREVFRRGELLLGKYPEIDCRPIHSEIISVAPFLTNFRSFSLNGTGMFAQYRYTFRAMFLNSIRVSYDEKNFSLKNQLQIR